MGSCCCFGLGLGRNRGEISIGGPSGVNVGYKGVSIGGSSGVNVGYKGVSISGQNGINIG
jgi:hypothetical protein